MLLSSVDSLPPPLESFLQPVFPVGIEPFISAGFYYDAAEIATHGIGSHQAIDFDVPRGTPVLAAADGWYVATYGEVQLQHEGEPRLVSPVQARMGNSYSSDLKSPASTGEWPIWFGGLFVQGWHSKGRYTQYGHLDSVVSQIPYYRPTVAEQDLHYHDILQAPVSHYTQSGVATFLKAGQVIGYSGMSGMGWGLRTYDYARFQADDRPDFSNAQYAHYTSPHLHFVVFGRRDAKTRQPIHYYDPFGVYGTLHDAYPQLVAEWPALPGSLWKN